MIFYVKFIIFLFLKVLLEKSLIYFNINRKSFLFFYKTHLLKNKIFTSRWKKRKINFLLTKRFKYQAKFYVKSSTITWPVLKEVNLSFSYYYNYNAFQTTLKWIKKRPFNFKYIKIIEILKKKNIILKNRRFSFYVLLKRKKNYYLFNYIYNYLNFFSFIKINLYFYKKILKTKKKIFYIYLTFKNKRIFLNLKNKKKKNIFFLSQGMFIKFFEKKKSLKKNKNIKLLMAKFLRKLIYITKIKYLFFFIRNNPLHLSDFLFFLNTPIIHKYINPENGQIIEEKNANSPVFKITNFVFFKNIDFTLNKIRKKGRIKRKITRKIVISNNLTD